MSVTPNHPIQKRRAALVAGALVAAQLVGPACGEDSTTGERLTHATEITAGAEATGAFTNAYGWSITLSRAALSVGAVYYFDGEPFTARLAPTLLDRLARWAIPEAHAHPGHYTPGEARGQMTAATSVDLVAGAAALGPSEAVSGVYRSARFVFGAPAAGPLADALADAVVVVEGTGQKDAEERIFRIEARVEDVLNADGAAAVEGCVFEESDVQANGTVTVLVKPSVWLDQVDLEEVPASADGEPVLVAPGSVAHKGFARGLKKGTGYVFSYAPQ